ncbi:hypothetical protein, partial [Klebsiella pneumoniae]|uniref:hypothetical protein n=1 Tax=Klebsiella pneumoniae TaxID=573 RepID=UPI001C5FD6A7
MSTPASVYLIGCGDAPWQAEQATTASAQTMGFKAWNLLRMAQLHLPVPPAFVLGTAFCDNTQARTQAALPNTWQPGLDALQARLGQALGAPRKPLLLSVRSGA